MRTGELRALRLRLLDGGKPLYPARYGWPRAHAGPLPDRGDGLE